MRKFTHLDSLDSARRRSSKVPLVLLFVLMLIAIPPMFELGKLNLARCGLFGFTSCDTPLLDYLSTHWETNHGEVRDWIAPHLTNRTWNPKLVIPFACFWTAAAALMLRRGH